MKKNNFGIIKNQVLGSLVESFIKEDSDINIKTLEFAETIKKSEFLKLESAFYKYLESKHIKDETSASRYIDECISLFNKFDKNDYVKAHDLLNEFSTPIEISNEKYELYTHIDSLLYESLKFTDLYNTNVDSLHESYEFVLNHIKTNEKKEIIKESKLDKLKAYFSKEEILKKSIQNFNEKYNSLDESEKSIFNIIVKGTKEDKISLFEGLKDENSKLLMKQLTSSTNHIINEKIRKSIDKINKMSFDEKTFKNDFINLYNLKSTMKS